MKIRRSALLCHFKRESNKKPNTKKSNANFQIRVNSRQNIVAIVECVNGSIVVGYSKSKDIGLLISINNQKVFKCRKDQPAMQVDQSNLIFGNSDLKINALTATVSSNFGSADSFF